jgi:hypothetical protein
MRGMIRARIVLVALCVISSCAPGPALKHYVKDKGLLRGSRAVTVVGFEEDSFTLANNLRKKGFTVAYAKDKREVTSGLLLEISGCCPNAFGYGYCPSLGVEGFAVEKGQKVFGVVIDDSSDCPTRFYSAVADEVAARWSPEVVPASP